MERKVFYRLKTKDGIVSEIREVDRFGPKMMTILSHRVSYKGTEAAYSEPIHMHREYEAVSCKMVEFIEYEEV